MGRQRSVLAAAALALLALIGGALFMVMQDPLADPVEEAADVATALEQDADQSDEAAGRRRTTRSGQASIFGTVVLRRARDRAAGIPVTLLREGFPTWTTTTDSSGAFLFAELPPGGPYEVALTVSEFAPIRLPGIALDRREERDVGTLRLDTAVAVVVAVKDGQDRPLAGARVEAFIGQEASGTDWSKRIAQVGVPPVSIAHSTSGADGRAHFPALAVSKYTFRAALPGYATGGVRGRSLEAQEAAHELTIYLFPGHTVTGRVVLADDTPLVGALVMGMDSRGAWAQSNAPLHRRATTDTEGAYRLENLAAGDLAVWVATPGGVPGQVALIVVPRVPELDIVLRMGGSLSGTVTLEEGGEPVPGVTVRATSWPNQMSRVAEAVSDADGHYVIDTMLEGQVNALIVDKPGYVVAQAAGQNFQPIPLNHGDDVTHDIALRKATELTGVVRGPKGPLVGAALTLYLARGNQGWSTASATTDATGSYRFDSLTAGTALIRVAHDGHFQVGYPTQQYWEVLQNGTAPERWSVEVPASGSITKDLALDAGGVVTGRVETVSGEPLGGASVSISGNSLGKASTETANDGTFRLEGLALDVEVPVTAWLDGYVPETQRLTVSADAPREGVVFGLHAEAVVRGVVTVPEGATLEGAFAQLRMYRKPDPSSPYNWRDRDREWSYAEKAPVRADGSFELTLASKTGQFTVRAVCAGLAPAECEPVDVVEGQAEYSVDLDATVGLTMRGRIVEEGGNTGVPGAFVKFGRAHPSANAQPWYEQNVVRPIVAISDAQGRFAVSGFGAGKYRVVIMSPGYVEAVQSVTLPVTGEVEIALTPSLEISGTVRFADGSPAAAVSVQVQPLARSAQSPSFNQTQILSGSDGAYLIRGLQAGAYRLTFSSPWGGNVNVAAKMIDSVEAGAAGVDVTVEAGGTIRGRVIDAGGAPLAGVQVNTQRDHPPTDGRPVFWRGASTDADGWFEVVGLDEDTFTVVVQAQGGYQEVRKPGIALGSADLVIQALRGLTISGVLVDVSGGARSGENLSARRILREGEPQTMQSWHNAETGSDGAFEFSGLAAGDYIVERQIYGGRGDSVKDRHLVLEGGARISAGSVNLRLVLGAGAAISGVVQDVNGKAVDVGSVTALLGGQHKTATATAQDGSFTLKGLAEDVEYELWAQGGRYRTTKVQGITAGTTDLRIVVEVGLTSSGRVVDHQRRARPKQGLSLQHTESQNSSWVSCDDAGDFVAQGLDQGTYRVRAYVHDTDADGKQLQQGHFVEVGELVAGTDGIEFVLPE